MARGTIINIVPDYEIKPTKKADIDYSIHSFVPFGADNLFPQASALFARSSPVHRGVINSKKIYMAGSGLTSDDAALEYLFKKANFEGETIDKVASKYFYDKIAGGNGFIEVITDNQRSFLWFNHLDYTKCRVSKDLKSCLIHPDWSNFKNTDEIKTIPLYPEFVTERNAYGALVSRSIFHIKEYEPEFTYYGIPSWIAGKDSLLIDLKTNKWNLARLKNAFKVSGFLIVPVKDADEANEVIDYIDNNHVGEDNQAKLMVLTKSRAQEGEKADTTQFIPTEQKDEGSWKELHEQAMADVVIAHGWFRSLTSIADNTGFDTQRILNEYAIAKQTVIAHEQNMFTEFLYKVFAEQMGIESDLRFINKPPINDNSFKTIWEVLRDRGDEFDENDENQKKRIIPSGYSLI